MNQSTLNAFLNQEESIGNYSKIAQERPRGATPWLRSGAEPERSYHIWGQGPRGADPRLSSGSCTGAGGPRGAAPGSRSGGAAVRRYPSSKVRSSGCGLLEQP